MLSKLTKLSEEYNVRDLKLAFHSTDLLECLLDRRSINQSGAMYVLVLFDHGYDTLYHCINSRSRSDNDIRGRWGPETDRRTHPLSCVCNEDFPSERSEFIFISWIQFLLDIISETSRDGQVAQRSVWRNLLTVLTDRKAKHHTNWMKVAGPTSNVINSDPLLAIVDACMSFPRLLR
jgi:hypothetical protein